MNRNTDSETTDRAALAKERWSSLYKAGKTKWPYTDERDRFRGTDTASWKTYRKTQPRPKKHIEESIVNFAAFMEEYLQEATFLGGDVGFSLPSAEERRIIARLKAQPSKAEAPKPKAPEPEPPRRRSIPDSPLKIHSGEPHISHVHAYTDELARQGVRSGDRSKIRMARAIDISLRRESSKRIRAAKASGQNTDRAFYSSERMANHTDTGPSFGQGKKEQAKGIRDEKGKLTSKGKAIYARKNARLFGE